MNGKESYPPRLAIWLLRHACPGSDNEALAGDLVERFCEGRSHGWLWKQVLIAIAVGVRTGIRRHWPQVCYAIAGTAPILVFLGTPFHGPSAVLPWWVLPWPLSMLVADLSPAALPVLAALLVLAVALVVNGTFRWASLFRTGVINLAFLAIWWDLLLPALATHHSPEIHQGHSLPVPLFAMILVWFLTLLASAWLGCRSPQRASSPANPPKPA